MSYIDFEKLFIRQVECKNGSVLDINQSECGDVGCVVWDAALVLCAYIESEHFRSRFTRLDDNFLTEHRVIELGSGTGIVGILCGTYGADCSITDLPEFLPLIDMNIKANSNAIRGCVTAEALTWGQDVTPFMPSPHYILLSDCIYYAESTDPLVKTLADLCDANTTVLCCYEKRTSEQKIKLEETFLELVQRYFDASAIPLEYQDPVYRSEDIVILEMKKRTIDV